MKPYTARAFVLSCALILFLACDSSGESNTGFNPVVLTLGVPHSETTDEFQREFKFVPDSDFVGSVELYDLSSDWHLYLFDSSADHQSDFANGEFDLNESLDSSEYSGTDSESIGYSFQKDVTYYFIITEESGTSPSSFTIEVTD